MRLRSATALVLTLLVGCAATDDASPDATESEVKNPAAPPNVQRECGVSPAGLRPTFAQIPSSTSPGVTLSVAYQGDPRNAPLVLQHGFPDFWCGWAQVIPKLAERYFVVVPDGRGINRSSKPGVANDPNDVGAYKMQLLVGDLADVVKFAADKTHKKVALVAHDWGGIIAWPFAHFVPANLERLMVIGTPHPEVLNALLGTQDPAKFATRDAQLASLAYIPTLLAPGAAATYRGTNAKEPYAPIFELLFSTFFQKPSAFPKVEQAAYVRQWDSDAFKNGLKYYRANLGPDTPPASGLTISVPTTFVAPLHDGAILFPASTDGLQNHLLPGVPLAIRTIDSGHFPQREQPEKLMSLIRDFASAPPAAAGAP